MSPPEIQDILLVIVRANGQGPFDSLSWDSHKWYYYSESRDSREPWGRMLNCAHNCSLISPVLVTNAVFQGGSGTLPVPGAHMGA